MEDAAESIRPSDLMSITVTSGEVCGYRVSFLRIGYEGLPSFRDSVHRCGRSWSVSREGSGSVIVKYQAADLSYGRRI